MTDFLEQVVARRREYVTQAKRARPVEQLLADLPHNAWTRTHIPSIRGRVAMGGVANAFDHAIRVARQRGKLAVIAEVKRVSPALGRLAAASLDVAGQALQYTAGGAAAISVLVEPVFWGGSLDDLRRIREATLLPILAKDVVIDEYQILEARAAGADAVLLIAEILTDEQIRRFRRAASELSMGTLVEAHEAVAFGRAVECGALTVGVNARNLRNPQEIDIGRVRQLHTFAKDGQLLVAESGISSADDARLLPARVDAVLVGTALMRELDSTRLVSELAAIPRGPRPSVVVLRR
ncbi:MAG: indole-3-glycerol-phosphate synthase [Chloroflexi bacterium]|nr:MAG: indole-3-glycerol-phosphate synthase [Chloroflexota bacterium]TMB72407.1 MAG: indole-3-glycerol-phosphate synthase [Chloroflexota bacterium]TMB91201.1 MAG: indole-3-glycerol-phosphate synthase [Chloroflexota bacterium]TMC30015.1 MAG: indole-3-glycerol-phosphate synthase [Chloroflexota bacterium]TMC37014.1 MAG: indole-3-glycerol-phosphate synthase [Chloroflexota bacterium]